MEFQFLSNTYNVADFRELLNSNEVCKSILKEYDDCTNVHDYQNLCKKYFSMLNSELFNIYKFAFSFKDGLASVEKHEKQGNRVIIKHGYIDINGTETIPCIYDYGHNVSDGLVCVKKDGKWGFLDTTGGEAIPFIYDEACSFKDGLANVVKDMKSIKIDKTGKVINQTPQYAIIVATNRNSQEAENIYLVERERIQTINVCDAYQHGQPVGHFDAGDSLKIINPNILHDYNAKYNESLDGKYFYGEDMRKLEDFINYNNRPTEYIEDKDFSWECDWILKGIEYFDGNNMQTLSLWDSEGHETEYKVLDYENNQDLYDQIHEILEGMERVRDANGIITYQYKDTEVKSSLFACHWENYYIENTFGV